MREWARRNQMITIAFAAAGRGAGIWKLSRIQLD
jgi:hypothetical protein